MQENNLNIHVPLLPEQENVNIRRKLVVYTLFKYLGFDYKTPADIPNRVVHGLRLIPTSFLLSAVVIAKISDGYSYRQLASKFPVTMKEVRTIVKRDRAQKQRQLSKKS